MEPPTTETTEQIAQRLRSWRQAHPQATFDEIDEEVQRQFAGLQAALTTELAQQAMGTTPEAAQTRPVCAQCQLPMQARGRRRRRIPLRQGQRVELERAYYVCPACGAGLFPPG